VRELCARWAGLPAAEARFVRLHVLRTWASPSGSVSGGVAEPERWRSAACPKLRLKGKLCRRP